MATDARKTPPAIDADDEFHMADTDELETLADVDTAVLEALGAATTPGDESAESRGFDPYNHSRAAKR